MELFNPNANIPFMSWRRISVTISLILVLTSLVLVFTRGFNLALDFTGGTLVEVESEQTLDTGAVNKIFINTSGIGIKHPEANISIQNVTVGDKIIVSGQIATHGIAIMSVREGLDFETSIESDTCHFNDIVPRILYKYVNDIHLFRDPTRGGVSTLLNEIARDSNLGIDIDQKYIKESDDVAGACELLGLGPLYVANEGVFIAVVNESKALDILAEIQTWENGQDAFIIGDVVETHPRQVIINSAIGGKRVVNMLLGEQLPRIC